MENCEKLLQEIRDNTKKTADNTALIVKVLKAILSLAGGVFNG